MLTLRDLSSERSFEVRREYLDNLTYVGQSTQAFAHEVRAPLNNISVGVQFIAARLKDMDQTVEALFAAARANPTKLSDFSESELHDAAVSGDSIIVVVDAGHDLHLGGEAVMLFEADGQQAWTIPADVSRLTNWLSHPQVLSICRNDLPDVRLLHSPC